MISISRMPWHTALSRALIVTCSLGASFGSGFTVALALLAILSLRDLLRGETKASYTTLDLALCYTATLYVAINLLGALLNPADTSAWGRTGSLALFLVVWPIVPWLRSRGANGLEAVLAGAPWSCLLAVPLAAIQFFVLGKRAEALSGNALPFALVCTVMAILSLIGLSRAEPGSRAFGWTGFLSGCICIGLSESRGLLPVQVMALCVYGLLAWKNRKGRVSSVFGGALLITLVVGAAFYPILPRYVRMVSTIVTAERQIMPDTGNGNATDASLTARLRLWAEAVALVRESPVLGHGMQNRQELIARTGFTFSHFHNGYLTAMVDSGLPGLGALLLLLATPAYIGVRTPRWDESYRSRKLVGIVLTGIYAFGGLTNLIFGHDIYDSLFLFIAILLTASIPVGAGNPMVIGSDEDSEYQ